MAEGAKEWPLIVKACPWCCWRIDCLHHRYERRFCPVCKGEGVRLLNDPGYLGRDALERRREVENG